MSDGWAVACRLQATFTCSLGQSWGFFKPSGLEHSKDHGQTFQKQLSLSLSLSCLLACWGFGVETPGPKANPSTVRNCVCWLPHFGVLLVCSLQASTVYPPPRNTPAKTMTE